MPPIWMRIKIRGEDGKGFGLWLPLILFWPVVLLFGIIGMVFLVVASLLSRKARVITRSIPAMLITICRLRGLKVDIQDGNEVVYLEFA